MRIIPPPSPFLDAQDLNARYATQIRKLSNVPMVADGDMAWKGVDTFRPPQELESGVAADAVNKRFEDGRAWPRYGVAVQGWGTAFPPVNMLGGNWPSFGVGGFEAVGLWLQPGVQYSYTKGNATMLSTSGHLVPMPPNIIIPSPAKGSTEFTPTVQGWVIEANGNASQPITAQVARAAAGNVQGFARFNDPQGFDTLVLITDDWRDGYGEDGGRGRVWRILPGNIPVEVPLNGNDVWGPARLVSCYNGLVMLRQGNERHYFSASAVGAAQIQLNCEPDWNDGDLILFYAEPNSYFLPAVSSGSVPNPNTRYYIKNLSDNLVALYQDAALTQVVNFSSAIGRFHLERQAEFPGFYGNGAPALLAQPNVLGATLWDVGFEEAPVNVEITSVAANVVTAPNHNLLPGDAVTVKGITLANGAPPASTVYVFPTGPNTVMLYDSAIDAEAAQAGSVTGLQQLTNNAAPANATIVKSGASGLPMPPGREGCYFQNRLVVVNGNDTLIISDPLDVLHYSPLVAAATANLGESDPVTALVPQPAQDALLILKQNSVLLLSNFSQGPNGWTLTVVTREYGCLAPLSVAQVGADVWFLSRQGVVSIEQTVQGIARGVQLPVSRPLQKYLNQVNWIYAAQACGCYWNNRYFIAVPLQGQPLAAGAAPINNGWLVYNTLNAMWEGVWKGAALTAIGMAECSVFGDLRLCFVNASGQIGWLYDGFTDVLNGTGTPIADSLTTRTYTCGGLQRKLHLTATCTWDSYMPSVTVTANSPGVNEVEVLLPSPVTYDSTQYATAGTGTYVPGQGNFQAPYREDYKMSAAELISGAPDTHQNHIEGFRMRVDDWGVQLVIANSVGSLRVQSVTISAVPGPNPQNAQV